MRGRSKSKDGLCVAALSPVTCPVSKEDKKIKNILTNERI